MKKPTYEEKIQALKESIKHWEENAEDPKNATTGSAFCACCQLVGYGSGGKVVRCELGCPIYEKTGEKYCENTPYANIEVFKNKPTKEEAQAEVIFLKNLLIEMLEKKEYEVVGNIHEKKEEWVDITQETKLRWDRHGEYWNIHVEYDGEEIAYICDEELFNSWNSSKYKIERNEKDSNYLFRILKRVGEK